MIQVGRHHLADIRHLQRLRVSMASDAIWCVTHEVPVQKLDGRTGETLTKLKAVFEVVDSPYTGDLMEARSSVLLIRSARESRVPRRSSSLIGVVFGSRILSIS